MLRTLVGWRPSHSRCLSSTVIAIYINMQLGTVTFVDGAQQGGNLCEAGKRFVLILAAR